MPRSFTTLSPQEALRVAISIEHRNAGVYSRFAEMFAEFGDPEALEIATVFREMASEEIGHETLLESKYTEQFGAADTSLTEEQIAELIEVPRFEAAELLSATDQPADARNRAVQVALWAEVGAQSYYEDLAQQTPQGPLRSLYNELATMERDHVAFLEAKLAPKASSSTV